MKNTNTCPVGVIVLQMSKRDVYLEELDAYAGEHEIQQHGDEDYVANALDGHKHTLNNVL